MALPNNALVIDDDPLVCELAGAFLDALGVARVDTVTNGREALQFLDRPDTSIDFILCDLNMPELDGVQFLTHLSEIGFSGRVVIASGEDRAVIEVAQTVAAARGLQVAGIIKKPVRMSALRSLLAADASPVSAPDGADAPAALTMADLDLALQAGHIVPHYLPCVDAANGRITDVEALARWQHPVLGQVEPGAFIPQAESSGRIAAVTEAIVSRALSDLAGWRRSGMEVGLAVNMTAESMEESTLPDRLADHLARLGLPADALTIEVTERVMLDPSPDALAVLARLRIKGFRLAIDDFGTGFSNIEQLRRFPYSVLKVDRAFVHNARHDRFAAAGLRASVMLARELGIQVIAEGVEDAADWLFAEQESVDRLQGFVISRPLSAQDFQTWFVRNGGFIPQALKAQIADARSAAECAGSIPARECKAVNSAH